MCGAYGFLGTSGFRNSINILLRYQLSNNPKTQDIFNIRPTMKALIITRKSPNQGILLPFGIKAPWKEDMLLINAKSETVNTLRTFKNMFQKSRCLVPASFFFEWQKHEDNSKTPFLFKVKGNDAFSFAGLYNNDGFVILTTKPNKLCEKVHNRMPVILHKEDEDAWLDENTKEGRLTDMFAPYPEKEMESYPVSSLVNSAKNQTEAVIRKYESIKTKPPKADQKTLL